MGRLEKKETSKERRKEREQKKGREKSQEKERGKRRNKKKEQKRKNIEKYFSLSFLHTDLSQFDCHLTHVSNENVFIRLSFLGLESW